MTKEHNDNDNEDYYPVISDISSSESDKDLLDVFKALGAVGFRFIDYHETDVGHHSAVEKS
jgi:hypothetical protein